MLSLSNMPGINQRYWLEQYIAYTWGSNAVEKGMLPEGQNSAPYERKMAMIENAQFGQGLQLPVDQGEAHFEHCEEHLTGYKRPRYVEFRTDLPKTNVGKILRRELRPK